MAYEDGPFVQVACFCDMVLRDDSGSFSLIRIVDTITHAEVGPEPPDDMPVIMSDFVLVLMLKAGKARGRSELRVVPELPNGQTFEPLRFPVEFEGEERGVAINARIKIPLQLEGLYWFTVFIDDHQLTNIPLRVRYQRVINKVR